MTKSDKQADTAAFLGLRPYPERLSLAPVNDYTDEGGAVTIRMTAKSAALLARAVGYAIPTAEGGRGLDDAEVEELRSLMCMLGDVVPGDVLNDFLL